MKALVPAILAATAAAAQTGTVYARSTPSGAQVYIDGSQTPSGATPTVLRGLTPGKHQLRFAFPAGEKVLREVTVEAGKLASISVSLGETKGPAVPKASAGGAVVNVVSDPPGAELTVNGKTVGKTPCAARSLSAGTHKFVLTKKGCTDYETSLELKPGETRLLQAKLEPASPSAEPAPKASAVPKKKMEKECPLCAGSGHIKTMGCPRCRRVGYTKGVRDCSKCAASGTAPARCLGCGGAGVVRGKACGVCGGSGRPKCIACKGTGKVEADNPDYYKDTHDILTCPACAGTGLNETFKCKVCTGSGKRKMRRYTGNVIYVFTLDCWYCEGKGEALPRCASCMGLGAKGNENNAVACLRCGGTGKFRVPCRACRGRGWMKKRRRR